MRGFLAPMLHGVQLFALLFPTVLLNSPILSHSNAEGRSTGLGWSVSHVPVSMCPYVILGEFKKTFSHLAFEGSAAKRLN